MKIQDYLSEQYVIELQERILWAHRKKQIANRVKRESRRILRKNLARIGRK